MKVLEEFLEELAKEYKLDTSLIQLGSENLGSTLALPCFSQAQTQGRPAQDIAQGLSKKIKHAHIVKTQAVNGYLNLWLSPKFLMSTLRNLDNKYDYIGQQDSKNQLVIVDYFSPNLAKPLSIGHLRNLLQGRAIVNLHKVFGYQVITDNHVGDWGTVFGMWVVGFKKYSSKKLILAKGLEELGRIYVLVQKDLKNEKQLGKNKLKRQIDKWFLKLERKNKKAWRFHQFFSQISKKEMDQVLEKFEIKFDHHLGESFYHDIALQMLKDLEAQDIAYRQSDKSLVVDLKSEGIDKPFILQKSNGSSLYATTDIATLKYRQDEWQPDCIIYVVGSEQKLHFKQLFAFNKIAKITPAALIHHTYGLIEEKDESGRRHKMSSRQQAILLTDLIDQAIAKATEFNQTKNISASDIKKIALGALIFQEFSSNKQHNIVFDWQRAFNMKEMSGPYIQYAVLRLKSVLKKTKLTYFEVSDDYNWEAETELILKILSFEDVLRRSFDDLEPSKLAFYLFELSKIINRYYEKTQILDEKLVVQSSRLWLIEITYRHMIFCLSILGIKVPSQM